MIYTLVNTSKTAEDIELSLTAYHNCDDVQLFWRAKVDGKMYEKIPRCLGFKIERQRMTKNNDWGKIEILKNRVGFSDNNASEKAYLPMPSSIWPFQRYDWTDHGANSGQTVRYNVKAMYLPEGGVAGNDILLEIADSGWTEAITVSAKSENGISAYFNRGIVISQFLARLIQKNSWTLENIKEHVAKLNDPLRLFLSGELRTEMLKIIEEVLGDKDLELYAALYELSDEELITQLIKLQGRAHVVLANGSVKGGDGNKCAREKLRNSGVDVYNRCLKVGLAHNKFVVVAKGGTALKAWTGSTNWSTTGLCTQLNNGILIENSEIAKEFLDQWHRLANAGNKFTPELVNANDESPQKKNCAEVWFTRMHNRSKENGLGRDLQALVDLVKEAKHAILFVMFSPGDEPLNSILKRSSHIYVRGVVNTISKSEEKFLLYGDKESAKEYKTAMVQPEGIKNGFSAWVEEVTRGQFLYPIEHPGIGHAITHAKMIVIDPLSDNCKVISGSHNFSKSASEKNDENFLIIHANRPLAEAYAVSCLATYTHYRWRAYLKEMATAGKKPWSHLSGDPDWQANYLSPERRKHLDLWCR